MHRMAGGEQPGGCIQHPAAVDTRAGLGNMVALNVKQGWKPGENVLVLHSDSSVCSSRILTGFGGRRWKLPRCSSSFPSLFTLALYIRSLGIDRYHSDAHRTVRSEELAWRGWGSRDNLFSSERHSLYCKSLQTHHAGLAGHEACHSPPLRVTACVGRIHLPPGVAVSPDAPQRGARIQLVSLPPPGMVAVPPWVRVEEVPASPSLTSRGRARRTKRKRRR